MENLKTQIQHAVNAFKTVATPSEQPNPSQKVSKKSKIHIILKIL